jgi:hypothetical protein
MMGKCICSVNIGLTSGFSLDTTVAWSRALILIIIPGGWCVWELILINSTFEMVLLKDVGQEERNPLFALIVGKVIVI